MDNDNTVIETIHNEPDVHEIWAGIGGHFDSLGQIINEFVDNSVSNFDANNPLQKCIAITLKELDNGNVEITIEDTGTGIKDLGVAFTLGGRGSAESPFNEHGFGMKHALASANPDDDNWEIYTKNEDDASKNRYRVIGAPYEIGEYKIRSIDATEKEWPGVYSHRTGTLVRFVCSREMYKTIYKKAIDFVKIADALMEDLGFTYANIIKDSRASILLRVLPFKGEEKNANVGALEPNWERFVDPGSNTERINLGGGEVDLEYKFGRFNELGERQLFDNKTANRHYKHRMNSSGVEIRLNGRIICSNLLYEIWGIANHNSYNNFLVQINIKSDRLEALPQTRTSKNGLREGDEKLEALFTWIRSKMIRPPKDMSFVDHETDAFTDLKDVFEKNAGRVAREEGKSYVCKTEMRVFNNTGNAEDKVRIDLYESIGDRVFVYEGKMEKTTSKDVYQLRMYWDGLVYDGILPTRGYLVAKEHPDSVKSLIGIVNTMKDTNGNSYNLSAVTWEELGLTDDRLGVDKRK